MEEIEPHWCGGMENEGFAEAVGNDSLQVFGDGEDHCHVKVANDVCHHAVVGCVGIGMGIELCRFRLIVEVERNGEQWLVNHHHHLVELGAEEVESLARLTQVGSHRHACLGSIGGETDRLFGLVDVLYGKGEPIAACPYHQSLSWRVFCICHAALLFPVSNVVATLLYVAKPQTVGQTTGRPHAFFMSLTEFCLEQSKVTDMKIADNASIDDNTHGGGEIPPCTGLTPDVLPEVQKPITAENSHTGVSPRNAQSANKVTVIKKAKQKPHWYALRATYGREKKAYDYIINSGGTAFYPTRTTVKIIDGKHKIIEESYLPNILFAYGTEEDLKRFARNKEDEKISFLRFYCRHIHVGNKTIIEPLI